MDKTEFKKLLFKVAFCTMACDGQIHEKEVEELKIMDTNTSFFEAIDLSDELSSLLEALNSKGTKVLEELFENVSKSELNTIQELIILEVALRIINADEKIDDNEIKFIKILRSKLKVHNETIIDRFGHVSFLHDVDYSQNIKLDSSITNLITDIEIPLFLALPTTE